jgi:hypothetical protein
MQRHYSTVSDEEQRAALAKVTPLVEPRDAIQGEDWGEGAAGEDWGEGAAARGEETKTG